jgi:hypothetical protein
MSETTDVGQLWESLPVQQRDAIGRAALVYALGSIGSWEGLAPPQGWAAAELEATIALQAVVRGLPAIVEAAQLPRPLLSAIGVRSCRQCGCTQDCGCPEGCSWVGPDLCSRCGGEAAEMVAAAPAGFMLATLCG